MAKKKTRPKGPPAVEFPDPLPAFTPKQIKAMREARGLTQQAMAGRLGVTLRSLAGYEAGQSPSNAVRKLLYLFSREVI